MAKSRTTKRMVGYPRVAYLSKFDATDGMTTYSQRNTPPTIATFK